MGVKLIREQILRLCLALYRLVLATGVLSTRLGRILFRSVYLLYKDVFEAKYTNVLIDLIPQGTMVIDVGANIGYFTLKFAHRIGKTGKVIAIEPEQQNYTELRSTIQRAKLTDQVITCQAAAAEVIGEGYVKIDPHHPANHRLAEAGSPVQVTTIDQLVHDNENQVVSLIKIDVQGAEKKVLLGAVETLKRYHPMIFSEIDDNGLQAFQSSARDLLEFVVNLGYDIHQLKKDGCSDALTIEDALDRQRAGYVDYLFLPHSINKPTLQ